MPKPKRHMPEVILMKELHKNIKELGLDNAGMMNKLKIGVHIAALETLLKNSPLTLEARVELQVSVDLLNNWFIKHF